MMNRRNFLKLAAMSGLTAMMPPLFQKRAAWAALPDTLQYQAPAVLPTIIHVFLYGGPSELAGNLTNIADIAANSQNPYPVTLDPNSSDHDITANAFWGEAGGNIMESLLDSGDLSIYRTVNRIKADTKDHGTCVTQNLVGGLDVYAPGIATNLAAILERFNPFGKAIDQLVLPFVSFEGESRVFNLGDLNPSLTLRPMNLNENFTNPYERYRYWYLDRDGEQTNDVALEAMARDVSAVNAPRHSKVEEPFLKRSELEAFVDAHFNADTVEANLPTDPDTNAPIAYPDNSFGRKLKAAVSLAVNNPDTVFISLGSSGLGGWDDHSSALDDYPSRMRGLFSALDSAAKHLRLAAADSVVINVFGDFGRNVNLNNSMGWDHGNNQNLYTLGGSGIPGRALGKLVGRTHRIGTPFQNRQFTSPTADSYQCEPFSIASTLFKYFGVQNPEVLTGETAIDESDNVQNEKV
ncbi:MAG: DUF1501 domain-containing protein [Desulfobacteraceae bacterium]|jgi:hypothetical protein